MPAVILGLPQWFCRIPRLLGAHRISALTGRLMRTALVLMLTGWLVLAGACAPTPEIKRFNAGEYPERLSDWGLFTRRGARLVLGPEVIPYDVNTPLFSDYALKLRTVWLPPGAQAVYAEDAAYAMPVGALISKTFFYPLQGGVAQALEGWDGAIEQLDLDQVRLVETRLLIRQADGWDTAAYIWRGEDAWLNVTGRVLSFELAPPQAYSPRGEASSVGHQFAEATPELGQAGLDAVDGPSRRSLESTLQDAAMKLSYIVPSRSECAQCHVTGDRGDAILPIGITTRQLNRGYGGGPGNQIEQWRRGWLADAPPVISQTPLADWGRLDESGEQSAPLERLARSYLDANCGHCHSPTGAADPSGLWLDHGNQSWRRLGLCKPPIAAGQGSGGRPYSVTPGVPDASILVFRMAANDPAVRMPEIGRSVVHRRGLAVVSDWIASLPGKCNEFVATGAAKVATSSKEQAMFLAGRHANNPPARRSDFGGS